jgi:hypothetical protein
MYFMGWLQAAETKAACRRTGFYANYWQGGPASVKKVALLENQPWIPIDGAPKNHEKNASSCRCYVKPFGIAIGGALVPVKGSPTSRLA